MSTQTTAKRSIRERFNEILDEVFRAGPAFSMETLRRYEETGLEARQQREIREATPRPTEERDVLGELVFRKARETQEPIRAPMTQMALSQTLALAEQLENGRVDFRGWVEGQ
ncbi:hypothetical protein KKB44_05635 [Candidatus Micrarchaeota archaeon]|nr:hypothetical protein [Candidatus Micrarchaeota archaeon]